MSPRQAAETLHDDLEGFQQGTPRSDDLSLMVLRRGGTR